MKIDVLCRDGSPLGVCLDDLYGENGRVGVGGAESALLTMCEAWYKAGHDITLYNDPSHKGSPFAQRGVGEFNPQADRDVLINFRSPNPATISAKGRKVWWSCDQYTIDDYKAFSKQVDEIVVISQFHAEYFEKMYGITNTTVIDLPVRGWDYEIPVEKVKGQCLFSSVPDRGLHVLAPLWPRIVARVPEASLVITSGWTLWNGQPDNQALHQYRMMFGSAKNVQYVAAVPRRDLVKYQLQSELLIYPCVYDELFCITCSEAQWAGAWPITSDTGALNTTNMGTRIIGNPYDSAWQDMFVEQVVSKLQTNNLKNLQETIAQKAQKRFSLKRILSEWNKVLS